MLVPSLVNCSCFSSLVSRWFQLGHRPTPWMGAYECSKAAVRFLTEVLELECKPFNIKVMLVAPCVVATKIYKNHKLLELPENSLYKMFLHNIRARIANGLVHSNAMTAAEFAGRVISKADVARPPYYIMDGGNYWWFKLLSWLPRRLMLYIMWKRYSGPA